MGSNARCCSPTQTCSVARSGLAICTRISGKCWMSSTQQFRRESSPVFDGQPSGAGQVQERNGLGGSEGVRRTSGKDVQRYRCTEVQMYGDSRKSVKKAKGIQKHYVKKEVNHNQFLDVLRRDRKHIRAKFRNFKSTNHVVSTLEINKLCLSPFDDKRYILKDGIQTLAYGHYSLRKASCPHSVETP